MIPLRASPLHTLWISVLFIGADLVTPLAVQFPVAFTFPVAFGAWYGGLRWGLALAGLLPSPRFVMELVEPVPWNWHVSVSNLVIRILALILTAYIVDRVADQWRRVRTLEGLISICSHCKRIRTSENQWEQLERYISEHSNAVFSHGLCEECLRRYYPDIADGCAGRRGGGAEADLPG